MKPIFWPFSFGRWKVGILVISLILTVLHPVFANEKVLKGLIQEALSCNPYLISLKKEWEAKGEKVIAEETLPQPQIRITYFGEPIKTKRGPQEMKYGVTQKIPFPSKLYLKGRLASKEAEIAYIRYILAVRKLVKELKKTFYDYYFVSRSLKILEEEKLILENMAKSIQSRYKSLKVPQQDLVKINLEIAKLEERMEILKKQKNLFRARINKFLSRSQDEEIELGDNYYLEPKKISLGKEVLVEKALHSSPLILIDKLGIELQDLKLKLAKQGYLPDFTLMADYIDIGEETTSSTEDGKDAWMIGVGITVPLWFWKVDSNVNSESSRLDSVKNLYKDKEDFLRYKVEDLHFKVQTNYQLIDLYQNVILPQAEQNFSTSRLSYEGGLADFLDWLDSERNLIEVKIGMIKQVVDYKKMIAELEYIVGESLDT